MIETLEVFSTDVTDAPLPIGAGTPAMDMIQIRSVTGLQPVKADVNTTPYGSVDGVSVDGTAVGSRNIVLTLGLNPDWATQTFESLRGILYSYFLPQKQVRLRFTSSHMATVEISGYVESFEPNIFSKEDELQISIICPQPYFVAVDEASISGTTELFTSSNIVEFDYDGNVPTGYIVDVRKDSGSAFTGEVRVVRLSPTTQLFIVQATVSPTQYLEISTVARSKYVRSFPIPDAPSTSVLGKVSPGSTWLQLNEGTNQVKVLSSTAGLAWTIRWFAKFGGL